MMDFISFALAVAGFCAVSVCMERHAKQVTGHSLALAWRAVGSALGWLLLLMSLSVEVMTRGPSIGTATWLGLLSLAAVAIGLMLSYRPRPLRFVGPGALLVVVLVYWFS